MLPFFIENQPQQPSQLTLFSLPNTWFLIQFVTYLGSGNRVTKHRKGLWTLVFCLNQTRVQQFLCSLDMHLRSQGGKMAA